MKRILSVLLTLTISMIPAVGLAQQQHQSGHAKPYAGFETRPIKSLSDSDIEELARGGGWGLALPAELNGMPGPAHLLELKNELPLSPEQVAAIDVIFQRMKADAIAAGKKLILAEQALEEAFRGGQLDQVTLKKLVADAESARTELRYIHLSSHLETPPLLTSEQINRYKALRGYQNDPCASVPEGHDPAMWKLHNGCQ